jgi:hypothetical protein
MAVSRASLRLEMIQVRLSKTEDRCRIRGMERDGRVERFALPTDRDDEGR